MPVIRTLHGVWDAHDFNLPRLIPPRSRVEGIWYAPASGYHQQVLVEWTDPRK